MPERPFVHLHCHTDYSLLDGACEIEQLMAGVSKASSADSNRKPRPVCCRASTEHHRLAPGQGSYVSIAGFGMEVEAPCLYGIAKRL
jgi:hypothetical protein